MAKSKKKVEVVEEAKVQNGMYIPKIASTEQTGRIPPFKTVKPVGNLVLVERLWESELSQSTLLAAGEDKPSNQGYILDIGPLVNKELNIKVGDRIILQGSFVPVANEDKKARERNLVLPDMIKAVVS